MSADSALAGFVTTSVDHSNDEKYSNQISGAAAAVEALPAKIDGEIANCFDYYHFPSIQTRFQAVNEFYEPGQTIYFKGELINENSYPIVDGYLFVRIARFNKNYTQEGHDIVDEFFCQQRTARRGEILFGKKREEKNCFQLERSGKFAGRNLCGQLFL